MEKTKMIGKVCVVLLVSLLSIPKAHAQDKSQLKQKADDAFTELEKEVLTLRFFNALDGEPISGAKVTISKLGTFASELNALPTEDDFTLSWCSGGKGFLWFVLTPV